MKTELLKSGEIFSGIYKLVWESGHYYVGRSSDILTRYKQHKRTILRGEMLKTVGKAVALNKGNEIPRLEILYTDLKGNLNYNESLILEVEKENEYCVNKQCGKYRRQRLSSSKLSKENICRRVLITDLKVYEFRHILKKYGSIDNALKRLLELEPI